MVGLRGLSAPSGSEAVATATSLVEWWAAKDANHQPQRCFGAPATLDVPAKLSNEAVKCCECDASRQIDHNM